VPDRQLLLDELGSGLLERLLLAERESGHRAAPNPADLASSREEIEVASDRHAGDSEALAQLRHGHELPLPDQCHHLVATTSGAEGVAVRVPGIRDAPRHRRYVSRSFGSAGRRGPIDAHTFTFDTTGPRQKYLVRRLVCAEREE
jgi:hypothetical protein